MRPKTGRKKLLDAALKLFEEQGYFSTSVDQIVTKAGVSKGLVYNYFKSKEQLLLALVEEGTEQMMQVANSSSRHSNTTVETSSFECQLEIFITNFIEFLMKNQHFLQFQLSLLLTPQLKSLLQEAQQARANALLDTTYSWLEENQISDPKNSARALLALLDGTALHFLAIFKDYPLEDYKTQLHQSALAICNKQG